tara:strand:- start:3174 stop:3896 length:723 start_codon:yes stop_codon:yes gene_type:complete
MKYYFNFITRPDDGAKGELVSNTDYTFPTDPMYKQDGVYNQRCKYKISNFSITELTPAQAVDIAGQSLIIRFNNLTCINSWSMVSFGGANKYQRVGQTNIEFHIRLNDDIVQQTGGTAQVVQTLSGLDTQGTTNIVGTFDDDQNPTDQTFPSSQSRRDQVGDATLTTPAVAGTSTLYNTNQNYNTFTEEMIGMPCWGEQVDMSYFKYGDGREATNLTADADLKECNIVFTLEVEPIAVKL